MSFYCSFRKNVLLGCQRLLLLPSDSCFWWVLMGSIWNRAAHDVAISPWLYIDFLRAHPPSPRSLSAPIFSAWVRFIMFPGSVRDSSASAGTVMGSQRFRSMWLKDRAGKVRKCIPCGYSILWSLLAPCERFVPDSCPSRLGTEPVTSLVILF